MLLWIDWAFNRFHAIVNDNLLLVRWSLDRFWLQKVSFCRFLHNAKALYNCNQSTKHSSFFTFSHDSWVWCSKAVITKLSDWDLNLNFRRYYATLLFCRLFQISFSEVRKTSKRFDNCDAQTKRFVFILSYQEVALSWIYKSWEALISFGSSWGQLTWSGEKRGTAIQNKIFQGNAHPLWGPVFSTVIVTKVPRLQNFYMKLHFLLSCLKNSWNYNLVWSYWSQIIKRISVEEMDLSGPVKGCNSRLKGLFITLTIWGLSKVQV